MHKPTKKLKQLCQHYGVGSELAPGEGGVETKKEREEAGGEGVENIGWHLVRRLIIGCCTMNNEHMSIFSLLSVPITLSNELILFFLRKTCQGDMI